MTTLRGLIAKLTRDDSYLAVNEYWVYVPGTVLPLQAQVMDRMVKDNPHHRKGHAPIGAKEGMVFTDIRLHVALVLKSKNPHAFRPDLLAEVPMEVTPEILGGLASSQALIKIQYVSKHTLLDDRHLTFLSHLADAYADIGDGTVVYDLIQERLWSTSDYRATLDDAETSVADQHCRVIWEPEDQHGRIRVLGLAKVGGTVWLSESVPADQKVIATEALKSAYGQVFDLGRQGIGFPAPNDLDVEVFGVELALKFEKHRKSQPTPVRIFRKPPA